MSTDLVSWLRSAFDEAVRDADEVSRCTDCALEVCALAEAVRRTVAAHRAILDAYVDAHDWYSIHTSAPAGEVQGLWTSVRLLAAIYEDRPGFDPSWRAE